MSYAQVAANRYALILEDPPVSAKYASRETIRSSAAQSYERQVATRQRQVTQTLSERKIEITGSVTTLQNAIFVVATPDRVAELKALPGVLGVVPLKRYHRHLNAATQLVNAPAAWAALGGTQNAGAGMKIGILDSGIDQNHPAFQDSSLKAPAGYPICSGTDCSFTNSKVIVARSYVRQVAAGTSSSNPALDSRPDDYSPRDRDGHGTAVASCAAGNINSGTVTFSGVAPKAYLGNYKIYGSPEVNDSTTDDAIIMALEDAMKDGMDVINFSSGSPAFTGPLDTGIACGNVVGVACDLVAQAFDNAAKGGLIIVAAAGNEGDTGTSVPTFGTISSPGSAPHVIAVGATTNSHQFVETASVPGNASLQNINIDPGDSDILFGATTAPLRDVTQIGDNGFGCSAFPTGSLAGTIALIERGTCNFSTKVGNALDAGALGVVLYMADSSALSSPGGVGGYGIPVVMVSNADGLKLKQLADQTGGSAFTIDPAGMEQPASGANQLISFSSLGPTTGDGLIKPDLVAPGFNIYMAGETYDPLGALYSSTGYVVADGTSFASPIVAGAAALVKQKHPTFTADQIRSAIINTASQDVTTDDSGNPVTVQDLGAGKLDVGAAVSATVTSSPTSVAFAIISSTSTFPIAKQVTFTNTASTPVTLAIDIAPGASSTGAPVTVAPATLSLAAGASGTVTVTLSGAAPPAGTYYGAVRAQATGVTLRVPYMFLVGDGIPGTIIPLTGTGFDGTVSQGIPEGILSFRLTDQYGVPIPGAAVTWTARNGGTLVQSDSKTDINGIATAQPVLGTRVGSYSYVAVAGGLRITFSGYARAVPAITTAGIVNAAGATANQTVAPGSYISIFGSNLSDFTDTTGSSRLPLAIDYVNVTFDVPSANLSFPGHLIYVSANQINVQVPWELQGQPSALVKVNIDYTNGNVVSLPLSNFSPAAFEIGSGVIAALDGNNQVVTSSHPVVHGQVVQIYANGLGPVNNQPATGDPAPSSPLATTKTTPVVTIGGQPATVTFSGLAPGFAGLYQVNAIVPASLAAGTYPVTISIGGQTSKASNLSVQ